MPAQVPNKDVGSDVVLACGAKNPRWGGAHALPADRTYRDEGSTPGLTERQLVTVERAVKNCPA